MELNTSSIFIKASENLWDKLVLDVKCASVDDFYIKDQKNALKDLVIFMNNLRKDNFFFISCRLADHKIQESYLLEKVGFNFLEMVLHPYLQLNELPFYNLDSSISISEAKGKDFEILANLATNTFKHERFQIDPRIPDDAGQQRYKNWIISCENHPSQILYKFTLNKTIIGGFIIERNLDLNEVYWHLTFISPNQQGKGSGFLCWKSMLDFHKNEGAKKVSTTISARNIRVLNLYSKLNFRFSNPSVTYHWIYE